MNDVEGMALGILALDKNDDKLLRLSKRLYDGDYKGPKILFTMGTGTGLSLILPYKNCKEPIILPTESWATLLSPNL